jgi:DNA-directed RNA polymerase subunit beta'
LIEGSAIQMHPLVCAAYNADFDGDTVSVHVPLSEQAQLEAREIMSANKNILKPGSGEIITDARHDIILGCFWMTQVIEGSKGEGKSFPTTNMAITAYDFAEVDLRAKVTVLPSENLKYAQYGGKPFETTVGRLLFNTVLPNDYPYINEEITKKRMSRLINELVKHYGLADIPVILDKIKAFGFRYATISGVTWSFSDVMVPKEKPELIEGGHKAVAGLWEQYEGGLLTAEERLRLTIEVWEGVRAKIQEHLASQMTPTSSVHNMLVSGARGSLGQLNQMAGMKGMIANPRGEIIEFPITTSMKEGMTPIEYFISTHGARKGMADTALNTAKAGYLTRRLFDVAQDVIINEAECGSKEGIIVYEREPGNGITADQVAGRVLSAEVKAGDVTFKRNHLVSHDDAKVVEAAKIRSVDLRSAMTCKTLRGVCQQCYGHDLSTGELVDLGESVGVVAAQAIGEPGTQLTMRTFHTGGVAAAGGDITMGLPRVEEIFERRKPKVPALIARVSGVVTSIEREGNENIITILPEGGKATKRETEYPAHPARTVLVKVGSPVVKGDFLTDGSADPQDLFAFAGKVAAQNYIISEIIRIYELQGVTISHKHLEVIVRQMFSRTKITAVGDTLFSLGDVVEEADFELSNRKAKEEGTEPAKGKILVLGIGEVSLSRASFLSAVSCQNTTRKLTEAAVSGAEDPLIGLKENVIIGRLIPAGSGFKGSRKHQMIQDLEASFEPEEESIPRSMRVRDDSSF